MKCTIEIRDDEHKAVLIYTSLAVANSSCGCKAKPMTVTEQKEVNNLKKKLLALGVNIQFTRVAGALAAYVTGKKIKEIAKLDEVSKITQNYNR